MVLFGLCYRDLLGTAGGARQKKKEQKHKNISFIEKKKQPNQLKIQVFKSGFFFFFKCSFFLFFLEKCCRKSECFERAFVRAGFTACVYIIIPNQKESNVQKKKKKNVYVRSTSLILAFHHRIVLVWLSKLLHSLDTIFDCRLAVSLNMYIVFLCL